MGGHLITSVHITREKASGTLGYCHLRRNLFLVKLILDKLERASSREKNIFCKIVRRALVQIFCISCPPLLVNVRMHSAYSRQNNKFS